MWIALTVIFITLVVIIGGGFLLYYLNGTPGRGTSPPASPSYGGTVYRSDNTQPTGCAPKNGQWSIPGAGAQGRSKLNSPCCQPPDYTIYDPSYRTCDTADSETDPTIKACLKQACKYCELEKGNMDPSWYPMCKCGASLCCYNSNNPHFAKYETCVHYISGDLAEATTPDDGPASAGDWRGWVNF